MQRDLRQTPLYLELERYASSWLQPGTGLIRDAVDLAVSPDGRWLAYGGVLVAQLAGGLTTRICLLELATGKQHVATFGPHTDRRPCWSPDGTQLAFLSDRDAAGQFQPYLLDLQSGAARALPRPGGWVETIQFSPDGARLLYGVAGFGADLSGTEGAIAGGAGVEDLPPWMPLIETGGEAFRWRSLQILNLATDELRVVTDGRLSFWEACWAGPNALAAIASDGPAEASWYTARLYRIDLTGNDVRELLRPKDQLGLLSASRSGWHLAIVDASCSDRAVVAGEVAVLDVEGRAARVDARGVDVTYTRWLSEDAVLYAGVRGFETVVGRYAVSTRTAIELFKSDRLTVGPRFNPEVAPLPQASGGFVAVTQGFLDPPAIVQHDASGTRTLRSFALDASQSLLDGIEARSVRWPADDGLEIQAWLLGPRTTDPRPLVMEVHGGPIWCHRPRYLGVGGYTLALLRRGYTVLLPNPRGSSGRGREYAVRVFGDMGGVDAEDCLRGLDKLTAEGVADGKRIGVMGSSYGGFMASWIITQDTRFAAAVAIAPVTNWVSERLTCNVPHFCEQLLADDMASGDGKYFTRSPVMHAKNARTPTLSICGALDRICPPGQATEFHHALQLNGVESALVTYPHEGHGIRSYPASIDFATRVVGWFASHMPPDSSCGA